MRVAAMEDGISPRISTHPRMTLHFSGHEHEIERIRTLFLPPLLFALLFAYGTTTLSLLGNCSYELTSI